MKTNNDSTETFESTYALIVRSEERERSVSENAVYLVFMLSVLFSIWQAAQQPFKVPTTGLVPSNAIVQSTAPTSFSV